MLRGFFIFLVFICKPSIWRALRERHPRLAARLAAFVFCGGGWWFLARQNSPTRNNTVSGGDNNQMVVLNGNEI